MPTPSSDPRLITTGLPVPGETYCDQVYIVKADDGAWVAVMTTGSGKEGERGQHITAQRSTDQGKTWCDLVDIEPANGPESSYAVLLKVPSGRIYAFYNHNTDGVKEVQSELGIPFTRVDSLGHYVFKYSDDHGRSWSPQRYDIAIRDFDIDRGNLYQGKLKMFWNVGRPFVSSAGKVYLPHIKIAAMGDGFFAQSEGALLCSDNILHERIPGKIRFETLPEGGVGLRTPNGGGRIAEEQSIVELSDGTLYCVYRSIDGYPVCTYSRDKGKTWAPPAYKSYTSGGRLIKHPRAANFVWRCENGRFLYWFHNNGGGTAARGDWNAYNYRNPVWLTAGREVPTPHGLEIEWSQPEIILYADDPFTRMSYPDLVEEGGHYFVTETQKTIARLHQLDGRMLEKLFSQHESCEIAGDELALDIQGEALQPEIAFPRFNDFFVPDESSEDRPGIPTRTGFSIEATLEVAPATSNQVLLDTLSSSGQGLQIALQTGGRLSLYMNDGETGCTWTSQAAIFTEGQRHHVVLVVDGGPHLISAIVDGQFLDGGEERQFGWGRFSPQLKHTNGRETASVNTATVLALRVYRRALLTSEAIANWRASL